MDRKTYLEQTEKKLRNQNIAKLYFEDDLSIRQIQEQYYPELSQTTILRKAHANRASLQGEKNGQNS